MKKALMKDCIKEIKNTYKRFLSILLMAFLGVGFFAGIKATSPDMLDTINNYNERQNVYDIQVISSLGLTQEDISEISKIQNVEEVVGTYEIDGKMEIDNIEQVVKIMCKEDINVPKLIEGKLPEEEHECAVEPEFLIQNNKRIGDTIEIYVEDVENDNGEEVEYLINKELEIVGTVQSPLYISTDRGSSTLGSGKVDYYIYIDKDNINAKDIYTNIYIKVKDSDNYETSSDKYKELINETRNKVENIRAERENARQNDLIEIATEKLEKAENEFNDKKTEAEEEITNAETEIEEAKKQIENGKLQIRNNEEKANEEFSVIEARIESAKQEISQNEKDLNEKEIQANIKFQELEEQKRNLEENLETVINSLNVANETYNGIIEALESSDLDTGTLESLQGQKEACETQIKNLESTKSTLVEGIDEIKNGITQGKKEIENARKQIEMAKQEIEEQEENYQVAKKSTLAEIQVAKNEIEEAQIDLEEGQQELNNQKIEVEEKLKEAEGELIDAREQISKIEKPTWYILEKDKNKGYASFIQDAESIRNIGEVFPIVFFIVATLISLTSMTRMVEEERTQIGTLKALGYNKIQIASKYILYATLASVTGGILGMCVGFILIPKTIWRMYTVLYEIGEISLKFDFTYATIGLGLIFICIVGATIYAISRAVKQTPAILMRPKAPKIGKRVLLEKIPFIWKKLSFSRKVTIRNIFRYKKRFLMTIIGIMGCTALILTGFGLKDSISRIMPDQYEHIFNYDILISLKEGLEENQIKEINDKLKERDEITKVAETYMTSLTAVNNEIEEDVQIIIPRDESDLEDIINIVDIETGEKIKINDNKVCLTDKTAEVIGAEVGDTIILRDNDEKEIKVTISNIVENYVSHYVYMSKELYEKLSKDEYETNVLLIKDKDLTEEQEDILAEGLMGYNEISSVSLISSEIKTMDETMNSLNYVVAILIISAGLLAFVVLYNLSNVNISERIRELATIKVLGFYDKEVYDYVTRETILLTLIGIVLGLISGFFLNYFIIGTCETNMLRFNKTIEILSYVYSILITIIFTLIVNFATYFALKKIDMIDSLKSVE